MVVPSLVYFHIPLIETRIASRCSITGVKQESIGCAQVNSGFLSTMLQSHGPFVIFNGHDHVNDFCGDLPGNIKVCYGGGVGYHAYGKAGWDRRARVVDLALKSNQSTIAGNQSSELSKSHNLWLGVDKIITWKRLDSLSFPAIDHEVLWSSVSSSTPYIEWNIKILASILVYLIFCLVFSYWMSWWPFGNCTLRQRYTPMSMS